MTAAAFQATFTDWRLIKGRKVVQVVFEVPLEGADAAYQALGGMPDPGGSVWCAIARLQIQGGANTPLPEELAPEAAPAARAFRLTRMAGMACNDKLFWAFLNAHDFTVKTRYEAAAAVRLICHVESRREFIPGSVAGNRWDELYGKFLAWRDAPEQAA